MTRSLNCSAQICISLVTEMPEKMATVAQQQISDEALALIDIVVNCVLVNITAVFGIVGNILNIIVLLHHDIREDTTNILLLSLSVVNLQFDITISLRRVNCLIAQFDPPLATTIRTFAVFFSPYNRAMATTDKCLICLMSMERFVAVWFPLQVSRIMTPKRYAISIMCVFIANVLLFAPVFNYFRVTWVFDLAYNETAAKLGYSDWYTANSGVLIFVYFVVFNGVIMTIPWVLVLVFSIGIGFKIKQISKARKSLVTNSQTGQDIKVLKMLLTICCICLVTNGTATVVDTYAAFVPNFIFVSRIFTVSNYFKELMYTFNASINFVIYVTMSSKFANTYRNLFCTVKKKGKQ